MQLILFFSPCDFYERLVVDPINLTFHFLHPCLVHLTISCISYCSNDIPKVSRYNCCSVVLCFDFFPEISVNRHDDSQIFEVHHLFISLVVYYWFTSCYFSVD